LNHGDASLTANQTVQLNFGQGDNGATALAQIGGLYEGTNFDGALLFSTNTGASGNLTERMRIDSSGNVGIGESSPEKRLHVSVSDTGYTAVTGQTVALFERNGDCHVTIRSNVANHGSIKFADNGNSQGEIRYVHGSGTDDMRLYTAGSEAMRIDSSGDLLVGATSARAGLATAHYFQGSSSTSGAAPFAVYNDTGTANTPALNVLNRDESTDSTNRFIQFYGNVTASTAQAMGGIVGNGATNAQFATLSDEREKENITPADNVLDKVMNLNVVSFDWKFNDEHVKAGFIAQNVEEHFPEYVIENVSLEGEEPRKGTSGGMSAGYIAVLTKAIQEQQEQIELLKSRIETLEANNG